MPNYVKKYLEECLEVIESGRVLNSWELIDGHVDLVWCGKKGLYLADYKDDKLLSAIKLDELSEYYRKLDRIEE